MVLALARVKSKDETSNFGETLGDLQPEDLVQYGLIPEFVGRLPIIATLEELDAEALIRILTEPRNALTKQYAKMFEMEGVEIDFRDDGCRQSRKGRWSARRVHGDCALFLKDTLESMYTIPSTPDVAKIVVDESVVRGDLGATAGIRNPQCRRSARKSNPSIIPASGAWRPIWFASHSVPI